VFFPKIPRAVTLHSTGSPLVSQHRTSITTSTAPHLINTHTHTHTGIRSPAACQPTHSLVATQDCTALHFSSSHITFLCANILEAWRHQPCGKPCCQEQRRYVTLLPPQGYSTREAPRYGASLSRWTTIISALECR